MVMSPATKVLTADELLALQGDGRRELIKGELREMAAAGAEHGRVAGGIGALMHRHAVQHGGHFFAAETGFLLESDPDTVRAPDAAYVSAAHAARVGLCAGYWPGPPDLAVEVVSPSDTYTEVHSKALFWLEAGCALVLVVDPAAARVTRYRADAEMTIHTGADPVDCAPAMPGFTPTAAALLGGSYPPPRRFT